MMFQELVKIESNLLFVFVFVHEIDFCYSQLFKLLLAAAESVSLLSGLLM